MSGPRVSRSPGSGGSRAAAARRPLRTTRSACMQACARLVIASISIRHLPGPCAARTRCGRAALCAEAALGRRLPVRACWVCATARFGPVASRRCPYCPSLHARPSLLPPQRPSAAIHGRLQIPEPAPACMARRCCPAGTPTSTACWAAACRSAACCCCWRTAGRRTTPPCCATSWQKALPAARQEWATFFWAGGPGSALGPLPPRSAAAQLMRLRRGPETLP